ncbi:MAG: 3-deoxy-manno-octulosonate cytidylyltransferase [Chitinophagaceae bacterium]|nr:3-deoxy-manno-octulosonate cytidylyltransferase [Chitinophagaceae bacterium]
MKILAVIPARYASTRFPGKPLAIIQGKSMIQRVYEQAQKCKALNAVVVATDDLRIEQAVKQFNGRVVMTSGTHQSGTERCAEVAADIEDDFDVVINVQGDEPFIQPGQIALLANCFMQETTDIATLVKRITAASELSNPNTVKVVLDEKRKALYFSRSAIPYQRNIPVEQWLNSGMYYKHIGIYGYRKNALEEIVKLPPNELEQAESLEQLRWLANGYRIQTAITELETISVDTPEDLIRVNQFIMPL